MSKQKSGISRLVQVRRYQFSFSPLGGEGGGLGGSHMKRSRIIVVSLISGACKSRIFVSLRVSRNATIFSRQRILLGCTRRNNEKKRYHVMSVLKWYLSGVKCRERGARTSSPGGSSRIEHPWGPETVPDQGEN